MTKKINIRYNPEKHHRRSIRLKDYDYSECGAYFITICTHRRECLFGEIVNGEMRLNEFGEIVWEEWDNNAKVRKNLERDEYIVMPNHVHGILLILDENDVGATRRVAPTKRPNGPASGSIGAIIGQFKSIVTKQINSMRGTRGLNVWQRNYHEHVIRDEDELLEIREYIANNPIKWEDDENNPINYEGGQPESGRPTGSPIQILKIKR
jgi:REP element-mobilizing transposase RayT